MKSIFLLLLLAATAILSSTLFGCAGYPGGEAGYRSDRELQRIQDEHRIYGDG